MNIWKTKKWINYYKNHPPKRSGLRVRYDKNIDAEVKRAIKCFVAWMRDKYIFPMRVVIYVKESERVQARDGDMVFGTFFGPFNRNDEPYIRIATGDYCELRGARGADNALASIISTVAHELSHYFQWLNGLELTPLGEERQACNYASAILDEYSETREHP